MPCNFQLHRVPFVSIVCTVCVDARPSAALCSLCPVCAVLAAFNPGVSSASPTTMAEARQILYCAVARRTDNVVIAQRVHVPSRGQDYLANVRRVLSSPGWASVTTDKLTLDDGPNTCACFSTLCIVHVGFIAHGVLTRCSLRFAGRSGPGVRSGGHQVLPQPPHLRRHGRADAGFPWRCASLLWLRAAAAPAHRCVHPCGRTFLFVCAAALQREFVSSYGDRSLTCGPDAYTSPAKALLKTLCDKYNDLKNIDKLARVQGQVDDVIGAMQQNIQSVLDRGDKVDQLEERTASLNEQAGRFQDGATTLKKHMCKRYWKLTLLLALVIIIVIIIIAVVVSDKKK